jgi:hypothetical protein
LRIASRMRILVIDSVLVIAFAAIAIPSAFARSAR